MDLGLEGRVALVTGSNRGTGAIIAERLAAEGATVIAHGFTAGSADHLLGQGVAHAVWGDLCPDAGCAQVARDALALTGRVDILVNNYGTAEEARWADADTEAWLDMYQKNLLSAVRLARLLSPRSAPPAGGGSSRSAPSARPSRTHCAPRITPPRARWRALR
jgi:3-oxoacyl-[acyl-carrier protein] reductase